MNLILIRIRLEGVGLRLEIASINVVMKYENNDDVQFWTFLLQPAFGGLNSDGNNCRWIVLNANRALPVFSWQF